MRKERFYEIWKTWNVLLEDCTQVLMTIEWSLNANGRRSCSLAEINFFSASPLIIACLRVVWRLGEVLKSQESQGNMSDRK